ncbi:Predicted flavoprotein CzcO associated with the cation diffusion facilitator CzcD [Microbacterium sp. cf046]|uniref:flavin-containing monooxygenase n=1 Tax=Microbacterium sp. cf046 TaxID=1761803 RepID=UPI0008E3688D|nr:NAD(P)/FAD-dependent oxidoreductase [Microbacterium sp. cf046]SFS02087.1 Predicted flavoprotein CzcO associated with the cation diffusion facilitator CzcD [Microbacterium sp. cf046]
MDAEVLVVGAGPAGLAVAACLKDWGVDALVVDRSRGAGDSWRGRYDRLHLHTPRIQSALPGLRISETSGRWVAKDDMAGYVRRYARYHGIAPLFGTGVHRVDRDGRGWRADSDAGELTARQVVIATGYSNSPVPPRWPGLDGFRGEVLHAAEYRSAAPFVGRDVLVVGAGNTGAEIAADLAEQGAATIRVSVRTPPNIVPRQIGPVPTTMLAVAMEYSPSWLVDPLNRLLQRMILGDLTRYGMPAAGAGVVAQARATGITPTIDVGLVAALRSRRVVPVAAVDRFEARDVVLVDGTRFAPDAVIAATGYTTGLDPMLGHLGVLDDNGRPVVRGRRQLPHARGMRFVGLTNPLKGQLFQIKLDARSTARAIARDLQR